MEKKVDYTRPKTTIPSVDEIEKMEKKINFKPMNTSIQLIDEMNQKVKEIEKKRGKILFEENEKQHIDMMNHTSHG